MSLWVPSTSGEVVNETSVSSVAPGSGSARPLLVFVFEAPRMYHTVQPGHSVIAPRAHAHSGVKRLLCQSVQ